MNDWKTPSRSSPQGGGTRACLCPNGTYSKKCCDGSLQAQGIGNINRTSLPANALLTENEVFILTEYNQQITTEDA